MIVWDPDRDGPGVLRTLDQLARAIERASVEDVVLLVVALARKAKEREGLDKSEELRV